MPYPSSPLDSHHHPLPCGFPSPLLLLSTPKASSLLFRLRHTSLTMETQVLCAATAAKRTCVLLCSSLRVGSASSVASAAASTMVGPGSPCLNELGRLWELGLGSREERQMGLGLAEGISSGPSLLILREPVSDAPPTLCSSPSVFPTPGPHRKTCGCL